MFSRAQLASLSDVGAAPGADAALPRDGRRAQGAFFTPIRLVDCVVQTALSRRLAKGVPRDENGVPLLRILDPACGDGRFLAAALDTLTLHAVRAGAERETARRVIRRGLIGIERDRDFARLARRTGATIHECEALTEAPADLTADVVLGNPPYVRSIHLRDTDEALWSTLRGRYAATSYGEWDLYAAFLEQSLAWLADGGIAGLVVPSRWMTASSARKLRAKLARSRAVCGLVDFGAAQLFADATTYASVTFLSETPVDAVDVARYRGGEWVTGGVSPGVLGEAPWHLSVGDKRKQVAKMAEAGPSLGDVARIVKGAGTNADRVFVFKEGDKKPEIEPALLRPVVRGRDVMAYGKMSPRLRCLVPYDEAGKLIPFATVQRRWPETARYLLSKRDILERRERGRFRGDAFHCFGRPQNMLFLAEHKPKIVVPDVARAGRAMLDSDGGFVLDSAYAIRATGDVPPSVLLAIMNSRAVRLWLEETGVPLRGGYLRLKTAYLKSLPVPQDTVEVERAVTQGAPADEIDDLVRQAYGFSSAEWTSADTAAV